MNTKQIKILVSNGKTALFYDNFQIINSLNMVMLEDQNLYTVLKDSKGYYVNQSLKEAVKTLQENKYQLSFEQVRVIRDLLDECLLNNYGHRKYDGTNGKGYSPIATFDNPHPKPPKKR